MDDPLHQPISHFVRCALFSISNEYTRCGYIAGADAWIVVVAVVGVSVCVCFFVCVAVPGNFHSAHLLLAITKSRIIRLFRRSILDLCVNRVNSTNTDKKDINVAALQSPLESTHTHAHKTNVCVQLLVPIAHIVDIKVNT